MDSFIILFMISIFVVSFFIVILENLSFMFKNEDAALKIIAISITVLITVTGFPLVSSYTTQLALSIPVKEPEKTIIQIYSLNQAETNSFTLGIKNETSLLSSNNYYCFFIVENGSKVMKDIFVDLTEIKTTDSEPYLETITPFFCGTYILYLPKDFSLINVS